jgi:hypothetical protein
LLGCEAGDIVLMTMPISMPIKLPFDDTTPSLINPSMFSNPLLSLWKVPW